MAAFEPLWLFLGMVFTGGGGFMPLPPVNAYVQEDGVSYYLTEDYSYYKQEF